MEKRNKKFWSLLFGCLLANCYLWLVQVGRQIDIPSSFHGHTDFVVNYYPLAVTALFSGALTWLVIILMDKLFSLRVSDHILWLVLPTLSFIIFTSFTALSMLPAILSAALPALLVLTVGYLIEKRDNILPDRDSVW